MQSQFRSSREIRDPVSLPSTGCPPSHERMLDLSRMNMSERKIVPEQAASAESGVATPMMRQYQEIKAANPDCLLFYRMGDFYELFFQDAEIASRALGIVLTRRGKHQGADIPMFGVPVVRADEYLHRLIAAGFRVAVCEQIGRASCRERV